jgi:hypothetical protein
MHAFEFLTIHMQVQNVITVLLFCYIHSRPSIFLVIVFSEISIYTGIVLEDAKDLSEV